eukprot:50546-Hanusia_phi.AAC.1
MPDNLEEVKNAAASRPDVTELTGNATALVLLPGIFTACHTHDVPEEKEVAFVFKFAVNVMTTTRRTPRSDGRRSKRSRTETAVDWSTTGQHQQIVA